MSVEPTAGEDLDSVALAAAGAAWAWAAPAVSGRDALVVGCGRGHAAPVLSEAGARSVTGIDRDDRAIEFAARTYGGEAVRFTVGEPVALPFRASSFGVVLCVDVAGPRFDENAAIEEMTRVLQPDGVLIASLPLRADAERVDPALDARLGDHYTHLMRAERQMALAAIVKPVGDAGPIAGSFGPGPAGESTEMLIAASNSELRGLTSQANLVSAHGAKQRAATLAAWEERARRAEADGSAKHWELVAAREAQRRLRVRLHELEHRPLRILSRVIRGRPARLGKGPRLRVSELNLRRWD